MILISCPRIATAFRELTLFACQLADGPFFTQLFESRNFFEPQWERLLHPVLLESFRLRQRQLLEDPLKLSGGQQVQLLALLRDNKIHLDEVPRDVLELAADGHDVDADYFKLIDEAIVKLSRGGLDTDKLL